MCGGWFLSGECPLPPGYSWRSPELSSFAHELGEVDVGKVLIRTVVTDGIVPAIAKQDMPLLEKMCRACLAASSKWTGASTWIAVAVEEVRSIITAVLAIISGDASMASEVNKLTNKEEGAGLLVTQALNQSPTCRSMLMTLKRFESGVMKYQKVIEEMQTVGLDAKMMDDDLETFLGSLQTAVASIPTWRDAMPKGPAQQAM